MLLQIQTMAGLMGMRIPPDCGPGDSFLAQLPMSMPTHQWSNAMAQQQGFQQQQQPHDIIRRHQQQSDQHGEVPSSEGERQEEDGEDGGGDDEEDPLEVSAEWYRSTFNQMTEADQVATLKAAFEAGPWCHLYRLLFPTKEKRDPCAQRGQHQRGARELQHFKDDDEQQRESEKFLKLFHQLPQELQEEAEGWALQMGTENRLMLLIS